MDIKALIRDVHNFPKDGIVFKDITTVLGHHKALPHVINQMTEAFRDDGVTVVAGAEARGFIFGPPIALLLGVPFVPIRKPGKLPYHTISEDYDLEYGTDTLEVHKDAFGNGDRVLLVDDLLATGGTMEACVNLVQKLGAQVAGCSFLVELTFLPGRDKLNGHKVHTLVQYDAE